MLDTEYTGELNTRLTPIPEGEWQAHVKQPNGVSIRSGVKDGKRWATADVMFVIDDEEVKSRTQLTEPMARMSLFLDLVPGTNQIQTSEDNPNANVRLGKLKEALGIRPGKKWSLRHLEGLSCFVRIKQRTDENDIETVYSDVVAVSAKPSSTSRRAAA